MGAVARWAVFWAAPPGAAWAATLVVNGLGSFLVGAATGGGRPGRRWFEPLVVTGFAGGFTTFSTFSVAVADHLRHDRPVAASVLVAAMVITTVPAASLGWRWRSSRSGGTSAGEGAW